MLFSVRVAGGRQMLFSARVGELSDPHDSTMSFSFCWTGSGSLTTGTGATSGTSV